MHVCQALLKLRPQNIDAEAIREIVGDESVRSITEVAEVFGLAGTSVRQGWRSSGMPGERFRYRLADIVLWRLERDAKTEVMLSPNPGSKETGKRLTSIESRLAALESK